MIQRLSMTRRPVHAAAGSRIRAVPRIRTVSLREEPFMRPNTPPRPPPAHRSGAVAALAAGLVAGLAAAASAAPPEDVNRVTDVRVVESDQGTHVRVSGSREPTFTVFRLDQPSRVVIDLSHADVGEVAKKGRLPGAGPVVAVTATQFDDARARVGRLVIEVRDGTTYDVQPTSDGLQVDLRAAGRAVAKASGSSPAPRTATVAAKSAGSKSAGSRTGASKTAVSTSPAKSDSRAANAAPVAGYDDKVVRVDRDLLENVRGGTRLVDVRLTSRRGVTEVELVADGPVAGYQLLELRAPGRLALDLDDFKDIPRRLSRTAAGDVTDLRVARHDGHVRVVVETKGERMPTHDVVRTPSGLKVIVGGVAAVADARPAPAETIARPAPAALAAVTTTAQPTAKTTPAPTVATRTAHPASGPVEIRTVDLSGHGRLSRIVVTAQEPPKARVIDHADGSWTLVLENAHLPKNLERRLDASALEGPVREVAAYNQPDPSGRPEVRLTASLATGERAAKPQLSTTRVGPSHGVVWTFTGQGPRTLARQEATGTGGFMGEAPAYAMNAAPRATQPKYTGKRVDFTAKDLDIIQFLQAIGEVSKRNIVTADDVSGRVSLRLRNVPWDEALDIVLRTKGLDKQEIGNIIRIAPAAKLRAEREAEARDSQLQAEIQPLKVRLIPVNYADATQMSDRVKTVLTSRGTVSVDKRTNVLIVTDIVDSLAKAELLVRNLDTQTPQVLIEARIVEAQTTFTKQLGIQWGGNVGMSPATGNPTGLVFPSVVQIAGAATDNRTPREGVSDNPNFAINMPAPVGANTGGGVGMIFGSAGGSAMLNLRLTANEVNGTIKTISAPKVTTLDNQAATISQGISVPFSQVSAAGVNTAFIEARLSLDVTPHVTADGSVLLTIKAQNNQPNPQLTGANGQPSISRREASTNVLVKDGDTTVIGGIYTRRNSLDKGAMPYLSKIPILGALFRRHSETDDRTELLVFITPRILNRQESVVAKNLN